MDCTELVEHHGYAARSIVRHKDGVPNSAIDNVAEELPVALVYNGISHAVMMAMPLDLEAFAVGFSLTEGIVSRNEQIHDLDVQVHAHSAEVRLQISEQAFASMKARRRALAGRTGCGVCGIESLELLDLEPAPMRAPATRLQPTREMIARAAATLPSHQRLMRATGRFHPPGRVHTRGESH